jgi:hypothetical protein
MTEEALKNANGIRLRLSQHKVTMLIGGMVTLTVPLDSKPTPSASPRQRPRNKGNGRFARTPEHALDHEHALYAGGYDGS